MNYRINRLHGSETIVIGAQQYTRKDGKGKADVFACSTSGRLLPTGRKNAIWKIQSELTPRANVILPPENFSFLPP